MLCHPLLPQFVYVQQAFSPAPDQELGSLYDVRPPPPPPYTPMQPVSCYWSSLPTVLWQLWQASAVLQHNASLGLAGCPFHPIVCVCMCVCVCSILHLTDCTDLRKLVSLCTRMVLQMITQHARTASLVHGRNQHRTFLAGHSAGCEATKNAWERDVQKLSDM